MLSIKKHFIAFCSCCRLCCCCCCFSLCICHFYHAVFWFRGYHHQDISAAKCKTQRGHSSRQGRRGNNNMQQVASCQRLRNVLGEEPLQSVDYSRNAWQWLPLRVTEARGRGRQRDRQRETDRPKRLLATLVCVCVSASSSIHNRLDSTVAIEGHERQTSLFSSYLSL